jgi:hypothetical protein
MTGFLRTDRGSVAIRRQIVIDTLREHPWATSAMISDAILNDLLRAKNGSPLPFPREQAR